MDINVTFWGTRGSYPQSGNEFQEFGGHTSCVSLMVGNTCIVIDAGSGLAAFGNEFHKLSSNNTLHFFLSHLHMDHICGLPAFSPIWKKEIITHFYSGTSHLYGGIEEILGRFFMPPFFPVHWKDFSAQKFHHDFNIGETLTPIPNLKVYTIQLNHPDVGCGYRFEIEGKAIVYLSDTTHTLGFFETFIDFSRNADLLIYDATFDAETHAKFPHYGHSTWESGCELAKKASVKHLALYHHHFMATDKILTSTETSAQASFSNAFVARCGQKIKI